MTKGESVYAGIKLSEHESHRLRISEGIHPSMTASIMEDFSRKYFKRGFFVRSNALKARAKRIRAERGLNNRPKNQESTVSRSWWRWDSYLS